MPEPAAMPAPEPTPVAVQPAPATNVAVTEPAPETPPAVAPATPAATSPAPAGGSAQTHVINAEARVFNPDIVYIQPGDTVQWINMTSHTSTSIDGLIPAGATPWQGQLGENLQVTLTVVGIYGYYCIPHIGFGMMGVIVVGKPANLAEVKTNADKNLQGPFRRILGKLNKVVIP
jgi:pseudoazurin